REGLPGKPRDLSLPLGNYQLRQGSPRLLSADGRMPRQKPPRPLCDVYGGADLIGRICNPASPQLTSLTSIRLVWTLLAGHSVIILFFATDSGPIQRQTI